ncbi:toxin-antitoxin system YwqK family antitoxin [Streptomyces sp. NPDC057474]|uniref:toxin-antitoxin system YwqK family antitoxin n=1 Tax=Streptomyces sp. NPDC057474 TaxID=3346144 RepID=UPI00367F5D1D
MSSAAFPYDLGLAAVPLDCDWDMVISNGLWTAMDEDDPRLADALDRLGVDAAFALAVACAEWVVARVEDNVDSVDARLRIAAAWAAQAHPAAASLPLPAPTQAGTEVAWAQPLCLAMKVLAQLHADLADGQAIDVRRGAFSLVSLADHVVGRSPQFPMWLKDAMLRAAQYFPPDDAAPLRPVPRVFFAPDVVWQDGAGAALEASFLQTLDHANPYLTRDTTMETPSTSGTEQPQARRERPDGVPADAQYIEEFGEWGSGETRPDGRTGSWRFWRPDGTLACESEWRGGKRHGTARRYHDDGSPAEVAEFPDGRLRKVTLHRSDTPTQEKSPLDQLPGSIRVMVQEFDEDGYFVRQRFHPADGSEVDYDGEPFPPRPENVPEGAQHASRHGHWYLDRNIPGAELRPVGLRRFWATDGAFKGAEYNAPAGELCAQIGLGNANRSNPLIEAARAGDDTGVEQCLALGLGTSPGAALHAAHEGLTELALRLLEGEPSAGQGEFTIPWAEPERRGGTPDEAVWVDGLRSWVCGGRAPAGCTPIGTWRMWRSEPHLSADRPIVVDFVEGRPARRREYLPWTPEDLDKEFAYGPGGEETLCRKFEDGVRSAETEILPDGTTAHRRFHGEGALYVERIERDGALVAEAWFTEDGTRTADVGPTEALVKGEPVEWWRGLDASGAVIAEGAVRPGIKGGPVGRWRLLDADGTQRATVKFKKLDVRRRGDLGQFAAAVHAWRTMSMPEGLTGVDEVKWGTYETFFGRDAKHFPFLLKGLAVPDPLASEHALGEMWDEVLHQHTVSGVAGPTLRFMITLVGTMPADEVPEALLEFILQVATRDGSLGATERLKHLYDTTPTDAGKPAEHFTEHDVEGAYHEIYTHLAAATPTWARLAADGPGISRKTRQIAVHLLAAAPGQDAAAALRACLAVETQRDGERDHRILADLLLCLALAPGEATRELLEPFLTDEDPLLCFCAALTWVRTAATPATPALPLLAAALTDPSELDEFGAFFLAEGSAPTDAIGAFSLLPPEHSRDSLTQMCTALDKASTFGSPQVARALLDIVFPTAAYSDGEPLTDDQRTVVQVIADRVAGWDFVNVNMNEVLRYNGLPCDADALRALCAIPAVTADGGEA